jgi:hypothetical protein
LFFTICNSPTMVPILSQSNQDQSSAYGTIYSGTNSSSFRTYCPHLHGKRSNAQTSTTWHHICNHICIATTKSLVSHRYIYTKPTHYISVRSILILSSNLHFGILSGLSCARSS